MHPVLCPHVGGVPLRLLGPQGEPDGESHSWEKYFLSVIFFIYKPESTGFPLQLVFNFHVHLKIFVPLGGDVDLSR